MALLQPYTLSGNSDEYFSLAETFSKMPVGNEEGRPLFAEAIYKINPPNTRGVLFLGPCPVYTGDFSEFTTVAPTVIEEFESLTNSSYAGLIGVVLPQGFTFKGNFNKIKLSSGAILISPTSSSYTYVPCGAPPVTPTQTPTLTRTPTPTPTDPHSCNYIVLETDRDTEVRTENSFWVCVEDGNYTYIPWVPVPTPSHTPRPTPAIRQFKTTDSASSLQFVSATNFEFDLLEQNDFVHTNSDTVNLSVEVRGANHLTKDVPLGWSLAHVLVDDEANIVQQVTAFNVPVDELALRDDQFLRDQEETVTSSNVLSGSNLAFSALSTDTTMLEQSNDDVNATISLSGYNRSSSELKSADPLFVEYVLEEGTNNIFLSGYNVSFSDLSTNEQLFSSPWFEQHSPQSIEITGFNCVFEELSSRDSLFFTTIFDVGSGSNEFGGSIRTFEEFTTLEDSSDISFEEGTTNMQLSGSIFLKTDAFDAIADDSALTFMTLSGAIWLSSDPTFNNKGNRV